MAVADTSLVLAVALVLDEAPRDHVFHDTSS